MADSVLPSMAQIPNTEIDSEPEQFRKGPAAAIGAALDANPTVNLMLNSAQIALAARADKFTQEVGVKAIEVAVNRNASAVDVPDVDEAVKALYPPEPRSGSAWGWAVLGILAGALLSFLVTLLAPSIPEEWKVLAVGVAVLLLFGCAAWGIKLFLPQKSK